MDLTTQPQTPTIPSPSCEILVSEHIHTSHVYNEESMTGGNDEFVVPNDEEVEVTVLFNHLLNQC